MNDGVPDIPTRDRLSRRARALAAVRAFLHARDVLEVETPLLLRAPAPERHIALLHVPPDRWLAASPELQMKRLLAAGAGPIFQISRSFRAGERGAHHHPEFTLLEWYRPGATYADMMDETEALVRHVATRLADDRREGRNPRLDLDRPFERRRVADAFERLAGWRPDADVDDDRFFHDLVDKVEPALPPDRGVFLHDYPASQASLARLRPDDPRFAERFELYLGGIEVANGFTELADAAEQRRRFGAERAAIAGQGRTPAPLDERFLESLDRLGLCAGTALGVDRLLLALTGIDDLDRVTALGWDDV